MALIDAGAYDLSKVSGRTEAISDLMGESNAQYDALSTASAFNVSSYTELSISVPSGSSPGTYTASYIHGLGFPPVVVAYMLNPVAPRYSRFPFTERSITGLGPVISNSYFTVDSNNLYFNRSITSVFEIGIFTAAFYIFAIPLFPTT